jgi:hypothetical protein
VSTSRLIPRQGGAHRPAWFGVWRFPAWITRPVFRSVDRLGSRLGPVTVWIILGTAIGVFPVLGDYITQWPSAWVTTPVLTTVLLLAAVSSDSMARGLGALAAAFVAHNAAAIALVAHDSEGMAKILLGGEAYWRQSHQWILTGVSPEYELSWWVPAHFQLFASMVLFTYSSLGLVTLCQGAYEVDLMNYYVGELITRSHHPWLAIALGWHPWSVCRGVGYLFLTYEITSLSFEHLTGARLSSRRRRIARWSAGLSFLLFDGIVKFFFLDTVRRLLASNLL